MKKVLILTLICLVPNMLVSASMLRLAAVKTQQIVTQEIKENPKRALGIATGSVVAYTFTEKKAGFFRTTRNMIFGGIIGGFATHKHQDIMQKLKEIKDLVNLGRAENQQNFAKTREDISNLDKAAQELAAKMKNQGEDLRKVFEKGLSDALGETVDLRKIADKGFSEMRVFHKNITDLVKGKNN